MMKPPVHKTVEEAVKDKSFSLAKDVVSFWKPGTDSVLILPHGKEPIGDLPFSGLGAYSKYRSMSSIETVAAVFIEAYQMVVRDKCDPVAVHNAFLWVQEYRDGISEDMFFLGEKA